MRFEFWAVPRLSGSGSITEKLYIATLSYSNKFVNLMAINRSSLCSTVIYDCASNIFAFPSTYAFRYLEKYFNFKLSVSFNNLIVLKNYIQIILRLFLPVWLPQSWAGLWSAELVLLQRVPVRRPDLQVDKEGKERGGESCTGGRERFRGRRS